jgi:hypothetical protein
VRIACLVLVGCAAPAPTASVTTTGTLDGTWPGLRGAAAQIETGPRGSMLAIILASDPDPCSAMSGAPAVQLSLSKAGTTNLFAPGTEIGRYTSDGTSSGPWVGIVVADSAQCVVATGTTTLTSADPSGYEGSFELVMPDGAQLSGTFAARTCAYSPMLICTPGG